MMAHSPDRSMLPESFQLLKLGCPPNTKKERAKPPADWMDTLEISRAVGDEWLKSRRSLMLEVPSAILPDVFHTLINPMHPDATHLNIVSVQSVPLDARLRL